MSAVLAVTRTVPQSLAAVQVELGTNGATAGIIAALLAELTQHGYVTKSTTAPDFPGGWEVKLSYGDHPDQFAYPGDMILVTDATYSDGAGWTLQSTSRASVYGNPPNTSGAGTVTDFNNTFTAVA